MTMRLKIVDYSNFLKKNCLIPLRFWFRFQHILIFLILILRIPTKNCVIPELESSIPDTYFLIYNIDY